MCGFCFDVFTKNNNIEFLGIDIGRVNPSLFMGRGGGNQGWGGGGGRNHSRSYSASALPGSAPDHHQQSNQHFVPQLHYQSFGAPPLPFGYPPQPPPPPMDHGGYSVQNGGYNQYQDRSYGRDHNPLDRMDLRRDLDDRRSRDHVRSGSDRFEDRRGRDDRRGGDDRRHHDRDHRDYRDRSQGGDSKSYRR